MNFKALVIQLLFAIVLAVIGYWVFQNVSEQLAAQDIQSGFGFLNERAGFNILWSIIPYDINQNYWRVFWVGLTNTLIVSFFGVIGATILGFVIGIMRLSENTLIRFVAGAYIELMRNIPLLLHIFFWYFVTLRIFPHPRVASESILGFVFTSRGIYFPWPEPNIGLIGMGILGIILLSTIIARRTTKKTGGTCLLVALTLGAVAINWQYPVLQGFNYTGGGRCIPELLSLWLALTTYTAAFIAEIIRTGFQAIPKGQIEAAESLGFNQRQILNYIKIPLSMRVIIPPLTNQYLNLTKNSSLAAAIAYPDLVSVFAGTALNQTGQAIEIISLTMAVYLTLSLSISLFMNWYESKVQYA